MDDFPAFPKGAGTFTQIDLAADWLSRRMRAEPVAARRHKMLAPKSQPVGLSGRVQPVYHPSSGGQHACEQAYNQCLRYTDQLRDKGYAGEASKLYFGCLDSRGKCYRNEDLVQSMRQIPGVKVGIRTSFPPNKAQNGGGFVDHQQGSRPVYVPPSTDPISPIPRRRP
jgi:hypothetical protein